LYAREHNLILLKDAYVINTNPALKKTGEPTAPGSDEKAVAPVEIHSDRANYTEQNGTIRFEGNARVVQAERTANADLISGVIDPKTRKLGRIEMRGNSVLKTEEKGKASETRARDIDFYFDESQHLRSAVASGAANARSLEKDSPREIRAEK